MVTDRIIALPSIFLYKTKYEILVFKTTCSMYKLKSILQKTLHYRFKWLVSLAVEADMERVQLHKKTIRTQGLSYLLATTFWLRPFKVSPLWDPAMWRQPRVAWWKMSQSWKHHEDEKDSERLRERDWLVFGQHNTARQENHWPNITIGLLDPLSPSFKGQARNLHNSMLMNKNEHWNMPARVWLHSVYLVFSKWNDHTTLLFMHDLRT